MRLNIPTPEKVESYLERIRLEKIVWICLAISMTGLVAMLAENTVIPVSQEAGDLLFWVMLWSCIAATLLFVLYDTAVTFSAVRHADKTDRYVHARLRFSILFSFVPTVVIAAAVMFLCGGPVKPAGWLYLIGSTAISTPLYLILGWKVWSRSNRVIHLLKRSNG